MERAGEHLHELHAIISEAKAAAEDEVVWSFDPTVPEPDVDVDWSKAARLPQGRIAIIAGEAIYNIRAALDYLVFALAWKDSGQEQEMTQFPIDHKPSVFREHRKSRLKGVSKQNQDKIEGYQPYRGCTWSPVLRDLSNPDKHKDLTLVLTEYEGSLKWPPEDGDLEPVPDGSGRVRVRRGQSVRVRFSDVDGPVEDVISHLRSEAARVLGEFEHVFPDPGDGGAFMLSVRVP